MSLLLRDLRLCQHLEERLALVLQLPVALRESLDETLVVDDYEPPLRQQCVECSPHAHG
ncbi:MAG: hypothetical protein GW911_15785 [Armatimonadetes bacterium]|nr:hypothetical protein [Armatimonadota bacterium]NCO93201.1 hypothetical protein [Armatimonadota bacterium]NCP31031.1 hypothetical protein [Armatimonadota bacterium]NCQ27683.1 hypothetical protein [Armatimonadota bacterium]NDK13486.1 hypothetical protein [Armatimonadota bacterium]